MPLREVIAGTRRERKINYGDIAKTAGGKVTLFGLDLEQATPLLLTVACTDIAIGVHPVAGDFRPMATIKWGHGGADTETDIDCTFRGRVPLVCSSLQVQVWIGSFPFPGQANAVAIPANSHANFRGFVGEGIDGERLFPSRWVTQIGQSAGLIAAGQQRIATFRGFKPTGNVAEFLLLFDQATVPAGGEVPVDGAPLLPLTVGGLVSIPLGETRGFVNGVAWAMSSTPFVNTPTGTNVFVSAELEE